MLTREECKTGGDCAVNMTETDDSDEQDSLASHPDPTRVIPDTRGNLASVTVARFSLYFEVMSLYRDRPQS